MKIESELLIRYFLGECKESEKDAIHQWLEEDEANKKIFINERIRFDASLFIDEDEIQQDVISIKRNFTIRRLPKILKVAAVVFVILSSGYLVNTYSDFKIFNSIVEQNIYVPTANRIQVALPDGSLVWLNSNTTLKYPSLFVGDVRQVELDGEAYFEIEKNDKPFIVKTDKYNIQVLGTSFNVEAYKNKEKFRVELYTGAVKIYSIEDEYNALNLKVGEVADLINGKLQILEGDMNLNAWKDGLIVIENKSFDEIMVLLEKYYGKQIVIENKDVRSLEYRGKLRIVDGVDHALRVLQNDFYFEYTYDEKNNIIHIY